MRSALSLVLLLGALLVPREALAVRNGVRRGARVVQPQRRAPARSAARVAPRPLPPVALQLGGLRVLTGAPWRGVLHALARDAWPALVRCSGTTAVPSRRGVTVVALRTARGRNASTQATLQGGPTARDAELRGCVEHALGPVRLPPGPLEVAAEEDAVRFELAFGMPPLGARAAR